MGDVVNIGGGIVNPMAKPVLTLTINDNMQLNLQSALPPPEVVKLLQSVVTDVMIQYMQKIAEIVIDHREERNKIKL